MIFLWKTASGQLPSVGDAEHLNELRVVLLLKVAQSLLREIEQPEHLGPTRDLLRPSR